MGVATLLFTNNYMEIKIMPRPILRTTFPGDFILLKKPNGSFYEKFSPYIRDFFP